MNAADFGAIAQGIGSLMQGVATLGALGAAALGFRAWRRQQLALRSQQVAEEVLLAAEEARAALGAIRSAFVDVAETADEGGKIIEGKAGLLRAYSRRFQGGQKALTGILKAQILGPVDDHREAMMAAARLMLARKLVSVLS